MTASTLHARKKKSKLHELYQYNSNLFGFVAIGASPNSIHY